MLQTLRDQRRYSKFSKCEFRIQSVAFLGHVVSKEGIRVDPVKTESIRGWDKPTSFRKLLQCFVEGFSTIAAPLTRLTH